MKLLRKSAMLSEIHRFTAYSLCVMSGVSFLNYEEAQSTPLPVALAI